VKPPLALVTGIALFARRWPSGIRLQTIGEAIKPLRLFYISYFICSCFFSMKMKVGVLIKNSFFGGSFSYAGLQQGFFVIWRFLCLIVAAVYWPWPPLHLKWSRQKYFLKTAEEVAGAGWWYCRNDYAGFKAYARNACPKGKDRDCPKARGYNLYMSGFIMRIKAFLSLISNIMFGVFRRADELALAMDARNYRRGERSSFVELKLTSSDYLVIIILGILLVVFTFLNSRIR